MDIKEVITLIDRYSLEIILGLVATSFLLIILNIIGQIRIFKIKSEYDRLVKGKNRANLEEILLDLGKEMDNLTNNMNVLERYMKNLEENLKHAIKKVGIVRYDAFQDLGSGQSYSIALLDDYNTGFVLTSIYGRDYSYNYIKPILKGEAEYKLSVEEMQALDRAVSQA